MVTTLNATLLSAVRTFESIELEAPVPGPDEVLVRVGAVGICGSDLAGYTGNHHRIKPPTVLGHEFAGTVEKVGDAAGRHAVGDRVCVDPTSGCGVCRFCLAGRWNVCADYRVMGEDLSLPGAMAGLVTVSEDRAHPLPAHLSIAAGALVQPLAVAYHAAIHRGQIRSGETALIIGAGTIGLGIAMAVIDAGAKVIIADKMEHRLNVARALGVDFTVNAASTDVSSVVADCTGGVGADVAYEAASGGSDELLLQAVRATAPGGRVVVTGIKSELASIPLREMKSREKAVLGSMAHPHAYQPVIERIGDGRFLAEILVSHRLPFSAADRAFSILEGTSSEDVLKVLLFPEES